MLSATRITQLASKPKVRQVAVENFLGSLGDSTQDHALANLVQDARDYKWNAPTAWTPSARASSRISDRKTWTPQPNSF